LQAKRAILNAIGPKNPGNSGCSNDSKEPPYGGDAAAIEITLMVLGEQEAALALTMLVLEMLSCPVTYTQVPIVGYEVGRFCRA
jgi:hypothetical protein